jgi:hypothetical protein
MEIRPASLAQITRARGGQLVQIDDDVQGVATALAEIDPHLRLRFSEAGGYFVVYYLPDQWEEGEGYEITKAQDLDHRLVHHVREVWHRCQQPGYSFAAELDAAEDKARADADYAFEQENGELMERMAHALREGAGHNKQRIFVPDTA